ncbi:hypothetical protein GCM10018965_021400 [Nonomuraea roseola]
MVSTPAARTATPAFDPECGRCARPNARPVDVQHSGLEPVERLEGPGELGAQEPACSGLLDRRADRQGSGEGDAGDVWVRDQRLAGGWSPCTRRKVSRRDQADDPDRHPERARERARFIGGCRDTLESAGLAGGELQDGQCPFHLAVGLTCACSALG